LSKLHLRSKTRCQTPLSSVSEHEARADVPIPHSSHTQVWTLALVSKKKQLAIKPAHGEHCW